MCDTDPDALREFAEQIVSREGHGATTDANDMATTERVA